MTGQVGDPQAPAQAAQGSTKRINLTARLDTNGKVEIVSDAPGKTELSKGSGAHVFNFTLKDDTTLNVKFRNSSEVLDIDEAPDENKSCPERSGINTDQVDPQSVNSSARTTHFTDKNGGEGRILRYRLNFLCDDAAQRPQYDPIIINGGTDA